MKFSISVLALLGAFFSCPWSWWVVSTMQKFNTVVHHRVWNLSLIFVLLFCLNRCGWRGASKQGHVPLHAWGHDERSVHVDFWRQRSWHLFRWWKWSFEVNSCDWSLPQHHWVSSKVYFRLLSMMRVYSRLMQYLIESYTSYIYTQVPWRWLVFILQLLQCCIRWKEVCLGCRFSRCSKDWCVRHRYGCHSWFLWDL